MHAIASLVVWYCSRLTLSVGLAKIWYYGTSIGFLVGLVVVMRGRYFSRNLIKRKSPSRVRHSKKYPSSGYPLGYHM